MPVVVAGNSTPSTQTMSFNGTTFVATWSSVITTVTGDSVLVAVLTGDASTPDAVKWNGTAMTLRCQRSDSNVGGVFIYDLDNPAVGTFNLTVERSSARTYNACVVRLTGVDATTPRGTPVTAQAFSGTASATCTAVSGDLVFGAATTADVATPNGGQTALIDDSLGNGEYMQIAYKTAASTSESLTWTLTANFWAVGLLAYKPLADAGTSTIAWLRI